MSRRGVSLNTSLININNMSAYYNTNQITCNNHLNITGNTTIHHNLTITGIDEINHNTNILDNPITHTFNKVQDNRLTITSNGNINEITTLNLYIGNTYIFDQTASINYLPNDLIIISKRKLTYNRTNYNLIREPYNTGVSYFYGNQYNQSDATNRTKIKFIPTERGTFYLVSKIKSQFIKTITLNIIDNVYKYGSFITNSGFGLTKNLNVAGNMNVKDGMLYVVNDSQYVQPKAVGVGTTIPRLGLDMTNLTNYNDAIKLPKTIGLGTHTGVDAMIRFDGNINSIQGYLSQEWVALGKLQDRDKDTFLEPEISAEREDELEFYSNGYHRLTLLSDDNTLIGIATTRPSATLEINGNLNIVPDNITNGVDFCNDINHSDNYLHLNITNSDKNDKSIDFKSNNGGYFKDIQNNLIQTVNNKTTILNNNIFDLSETYKFTNSDNNSVQMNSNSDITITENFINTIENSLVETIYLSNNYILDGNSSEYFDSSSNINTNGDYLYNINNTKYFNVIDNTTETYNTNFNINIKNNITETITGNYNLIQTNYNKETYKKDYTNNVNYNSTSTIKNNFNTLINTNYNLNVKGNTTETYLSNFSKSIKLSYNLDVQGSTNLYINNITKNIYKNNLNKNNNGFIHKKISINKNNNIFGNVIETYKNSITKYIYKNNNQNIYQNYAFNLNNSYYYNVVSNKNITVFNSLDSTILGDKQLFTTASADNNMFFNSNIEKDFTYNINKISNLIVFNENDKYINLDSTEVYKKNKFNYLWLYGHPLSGPNTISSEVNNVFLTNYIKIVYKTNYENTIGVNPTQYVFPGYNDVGESVNIGTNRAQVNDWFIFRPTAVLGVYYILNSYNSNISVNNINTNHQYYILGPNDDNCYAIIQKELYNSQQSYTYDNKFVIGPRIHQLEYSLRTHYIKIFNIGTQTTNISLFSLNITYDSNQSNPFVIQQHNSYDIQQNIQTDLSQVGTTGSNEFSRFIFIYVSGSQIVGPHNIVTKAKYYIYSKQEETVDNQKNSNLVGFLCNVANNSLGIKANSDDSCIWTIEAVNPDDPSYNVDLYYIYNTNNEVDYHIQFHSNNTDIILTNTKDNQNTLQHFTFYYYYKHFTNITSSLLTYNDETRAHYLTKDFKYIYSQGNTNLYVSSQLNGENKHNIGSGNNDPFLLIYSNTITIPGSGTDIGTFKIFNTVTQQYLFNDKSLNWVIESIEEKNDSHDEAIYTIKAYNNGNPTLFLHNNNGVLDYTPIVYPIVSTPKFSIVNVLTNIPPGTYTKKVYKPVTKQVSKTEDIMISGNINETYKSRFNLNIGSNYKNDIKNLYNVNVFNNNLQTLSKTNKKTVIGNVSESIFENHSKFLKQNYNVFYNSNNTSYISGNLTENITGYFDKTINSANSTFILNNTNETYKNNYIIKSNNNNKTIDNDVTESIYGDSNILVDKSIVISNYSNKTTNITTLNGGGGTGTSGFFKGSGYSFSGVDGIRTLRLIVDGIHNVTVSVNETYLGDNLNTATTYLNSVFSNAGHDNKLEVTNDGSVFIFTSKSIGSQSSILLKENTWDPPVVNNQGQIMRLFVPQSHHIPGTGPNNNGPRSLNNSFSVPGTDPSPGNSIDTIGIDKNINITKNSNIDIKNKKNITIGLDKVLNIGINKNTNINKFKKQTTQQSTIIDYSKDKTNITLNNVNTVVSGDYNFKLNNNNTETYLSNNTTLVDNNLTETIHGIMSTYANDDITFNDASDFNISCAKNINLNSEGYVHIINDITNDGHPVPSDKKSLVIEGGAYIKKEATIAGDILINNALNVFKSDESALKTEDFEINDPLIGIGMLQQDDTTYSGILAKTFINDEPKFTGLVRNNLNTYALLNNINTDTIDVEEYSSLDMNNTYSNLYVNKHANFIANKIISQQPNINTHGDLYISKNIFLGIVDTPEENVENSFTLNIGTNINSSQNKLKITSDKDIIYNITNSQDINITSANNYDINILNNRYVDITNNLVETIKGTHNKNVENISNETYKKNYNINISNNFTKLIKNNYIKTIKNNYNINGFIINNITSNIVNINVSLFNDKFSINGTLGNDENLVKILKEGSIYNFVVPANIATQYKFELYGLSAGGGLYHLAQATLDYDVNPFFTTVIRYFYISNGSLIEITRDQYRNHNDESNNNVSSLDQVFQIDLTTTLRREQTLQMLMTDGRQNVTHIKSGTIGIGALNPGSNGNDNLQYLTNPPSEVEILQGGVTTQQSSAHLLEQTVKQDNNINILQNSITKLNSDYSNYIGNSIENLYSDSHNILYKNKNLDINNNYKLNVTSTNKLDITLDSNETYHNTNKTILNNLTETIDGLNNKKIYQNYDFTITNICKETYDSNVSIDTTGSETLKVFGNITKNINNTLNRTINDNVTETYKINYNVTISENLNSIISGSYNINVTNNTLNTFKKNVLNSVKETVNNTFGKTYTINVYENNHETYGGLHSNIDEKSDRNITNSYFNRVKQNSDLTINKDSTITNNKYFYYNIHSNSSETYGNTYDKYINNNVIETYRNNKTFNVLNNYIYNNNKIYSQHTLGISNNTFKSSYNLNLDGNLKETYYNNIVSYIKTDKYERIQNNYQHLTNLDKTLTINNDCNSTINGYKNITVDGTFNESVHLNNDKYITGDLSTTINDSFYSFIKSSDNITYNNKNTTYVMNNLHETYNNTLTTIHHTGTVNNSITNSTLYNNSVITKINNNYTKNIYMNNDQYINLQLNRQIIGDVVVTNNKSSDITIANNKTKIINNNFTETVFNNVNITNKNNKSIIISENNTYSISHNLNNTIYDNLYETFLSSKFIKKGIDNNTLTNYSNEGTVYNQIKETYKLNIKNDTLETYKADNTSYTTNNKNKLINGYHNVNITQTSTETYDKSFDITQGSNTTLVNNVYSKYIDKNTFETFKANSAHITNNSNVKYIGGTYNLTSNHSSKPNINITTAGNLNITADANINKNNNVNFITRVGIKDIVSYTPQIINTATITDSNISEFINSTNEYLINPKTINILYIDTSAALTNLISNDKNIYIRLNLPEGSYNGQIVKIIVHPEFEKTFDINDRLSKGLSTNIAIRINSFCDANENEYVTVDLLLNKGGMGLSLIYVDNNTSSNTINDSYWMLMNNNFIYE